MAGAAEPLEPPVWFEPLRSPSWLVPGVRDGAPRIVCCAEPWQGTAVDTAGRDLRLGLPLYLVRGAAVRHERSAGRSEGTASLGRRARDADLIVPSAVAPTVAPRVRVRVLDPLGVGAR